MKSALPTRGPLPLRPIPTLCALCAVAFVALLAAAPALAQEAEAREEEALEADAQQASPWYIEYMAGVSFTNDMSFETSDDTMSVLNGNGEFDPGYTVSGAIGRRVSDLFRAELAVGYSDSRVDRLQFLTEPGNANGGADLLSILLNGYADWDTELGVVPYVGFGIGWGVLDVNVRNRGGTGQVEVNDSDGVFVYNAMVGATVPMNDVTSFSLGYRFIGTSTAKLKATLGGTTPTRFDSEWTAHQVTAGLRVHF